MEAFDPRRDRRESVAVHEVLDKRPREFVCRGEDSARQFYRVADPVVTSCNSYVGEYPGEWDYAGRERMFFVAERAIHEGSLAAYALPQLPPEVRVVQAGGNRGEAGCQPRAITFLGS